MKNSVKLFGLVAVCALMFSCSTDEQDADLENAIQMSKNLQDSYAKDGDETQANVTNKEDGNPLIIIVKKD